MTSEVVTLLLIIGCTSAGTYVLAALERKRSRSKWIAGAGGLMVFTLVTAVVLLAGVYYVMLEDRWSQDDENSDSARVGYARAALSGPRP
jgi:NADH:ubiquinone oxidoreductase subunit 2 (subunit N)